MGTGGRAAVDGAMASGLMARLLKAGFGYNCSLKILNSSMLFKSTDESLATVDVACIDLLSGRTELLKAGAAPTVMLRGGKCGAIRHLDCSHLGELYRHLEQEHHFRIDPRRTLFYGLCEACSKGETE